MNKLGLFAFGITTCVLVPTSLQLLEAGPKQVAKLVAIDTQTITIDGAKVDIKVDRGIVDNGDKVHVTLTASADNRARAKVGVMVLEQEGMGEGRVELPPQLVGSEEVTLDTKSEASATRTFAFTLKGNRISSMDGPSIYGHYTILVGTTSEIDKLEKARRHAENNGDSFSSTLYQLAHPENEDAPAIQVARLDINTRPTKSALSIAVADTAPMGDDFTVTVNLKNPSSHAFAKIQVDLSASPGLGGDDYRGLAEDTVTITGGDDTIALAAHETKSVTFRVHATQPGTLGLFATSRCVSVSGDDDDNGQCYSVAGARQLSDSVLDAVDIVPSHVPVEQDAPSVVVAPTIAPVPGSVPVVVEPTATVSSKTATTVVLK